MHLRVLLTVLMLTFVSSFVKHNVKSCAISSRIFSSNSESSNAIKKVLVPIAHGSEEIEAVIVADSLVRAGAKVTIASVMPELEVVMSRGIRISADTYIEKCVDVDWDMIVIPGGMPGSNHLRDSTVLKSLLIKQNRIKKPIGAICAAPAVVLGTHGLLSGKTATCYPAEKFQSTIQKFSNNRVVVYENIISSQGPGTSFEFAIALIEVLFGKEKSLAIAKEMLLS